MVEAYVIMPHLSPCIEYLDINYNLPSSKLIVTCIKLASYPVLQQQKRKKKLEFIDLFDVLFV
jgi:hypothetical protein